MENVQIFEQAITTPDGRPPAKLAILRGDIRLEKPIAYMNAAVSEYVGNKGINQFIEINLDNPWLRVIVSGINDIDFQDFTTQRL